MKKKRKEELNGTMSKMNERIDETENKIDCLKKYSRRNCILIIEENTDQQTTDFINDNLAIEIYAIDIDRSHRKKQDLL